MGFGPKAMAMEMQQGRLFGVGAGRCCWRAELFSPTALEVMGMGMGVGHPNQIRVRDALITFSRLGLCHQPLETACPTLVLVPLVPDVGTVGQWC